MKRILSVCFLLVFFFTSLFIVVTESSSDELDDINKKINDLTSALNMSINATKPLEGELNRLKAEIAGIKNQVATIEEDITIKKKNIDTGYKNLEKQEAILNKSIRSFYIKSYYNSPLLIFLQSSSASEITQLLAYQKAQADQDKAIITNIALSIADLEEKKANLEQEQVRLTAIKANLDEQSGKLDKVVQGAKAYQSGLSTQIAQLTVRQREILGQRLASLNLPKSAYTTQGGCVDDREVDPGFSPRLAFFTYGVPHRVGLNQYGAKGRAESGQNAEQILKAYYSADYTTGYNTGITIHVTGTNEYGQSFDDQWNIEEYLRHVYEVPSNWPMEVLKAQAIAARSYALARTNNGTSSICPSQRCQVVKREENADSWKQAVSETAGVVMTSGGNPISAWYSSTHGGYVFASSNDISGAAWTKNVKDTTTDSINSFSDLQSNAYDKSSPWFYCDWGSRAQYNKTAWLKSDEVADIVNTLLLVKADSSVSEHLYQTDKPNPAGTDNWDESRVKDELRKKGITPYNFISSVSINADFGSGRTTSVNLSGDSGSVDFNGEDFKNRFNLRAPANIQIVGLLYNIERK